MQNTCKSIKPGTALHILPKCYHTWSGAFKWDKPAWLLRLYCCLVVPSSDPVNVPRIRTSASEEHSAGNISRAASAERSLLSQQIRLNSDTSLSQMSNGTAAHVRQGFPEAAGPQVGSSRQSFPPLAPSKQESGSDDGSHLLNGGLHATAGALQNGTLHEGFGEQPSAEIQSQRKQAPSIDWQPHALPDTGDQHQGQVQVSLLRMWLVYRCLAS